MGLRWHIRPVSCNHLSPQLQDDVLVPKTRCNTHSITSSTEKEEPVREADGVGGQDKTVLFEHWGGCSQVH